MDPFESSNNLGRSVSQTGYERIKNAFKISAEIMNGGIEKLFKTYEELPGPQIMLNQSHFSLISNTDNSKIEILPTGSKINSFSFLSRN